MKRLFLLNVLLFTSVVYTADQTTPFTEEQIQGIENYMSTLGNTEDVISVYLRRGESMKITFIERTDGNREMEIDVTQMTNCMTDGDPLKEVEDLKTVAAVIASIHQGSMIAAQFKKS